MSERQKRATTSDMDIGHEPPAAGQGKSAGTGGGLPAYVHKEIQESEPSLGIAANAEAYVHYRVNLARAEQAHAALQKKGQHVRDFTPEQIKAHGEHPIGDLFAGDVLFLRIGEVVLIIGGIALGVVVGLFFASALATTAVGYAAYTALGFLGSVITILGLAAVLETFAPDGRSLFNTGGPLGNIGSRRVSAAVVAAALTLWH